MWKQYKNYTHILSIDPSGDYTKHKGTTGFCFMNTYYNQLEVFDIRAGTYKDKESYWSAIINVIDSYRAVYGDIVVVVEDYILYTEQAQSQSLSLLETPRLIGIIQWYCYINDIACYAEFASVVKTRWSIPILEHKGYITKSKNKTLVNGQPCSNHCIDALRHAVHYATFINGNPEVLKK